MKAFSDYDKTQTASAGVGKLPVGGYILKILDAKVQTYSSGSQQLVISFDIAEGDHKDYYKEKYTASKYEDKKWSGTYRLWLPKDDGSEQDGWTKKKLKTAFVAIEESNSGYHWDWDENKLKGKMVGGVFGEKEWENKDTGATGVYTACSYFCKVDDIRAGKFKVPDLVPLKNKPTGSVPDGFVNVPDDATMDELPFK